jgi:hypothetical protein
MRPARFGVSEPLMRVAVQAAAFFVLCPDDVLDPDYRQ